MPRPQHLLVAALLVAHPALGSAQRLVGDNSIGRPTGGFERRTASWQLLRALRISNLSTRPGRLTVLSGALRPPARLKWRASELALAGAFTAVLLVDAGQTRGLARDGWRSYREANPLLGPRPGVTRVDVYTALAGLGVLGATAALPSQVRRWLLGGALAVETVTVAGNARRGVRVRF